MFKGHRIAVVVPAYNEAGKIAHSIRSIPGFVDHVIVIDDASRDHTYRIANRSQRRGLRIIRHQQNRGVGAAITTGYIAAREAGADFTAVMAGDSQMDPADLISLLEPLASERVDYTKGNRFSWPGVFRIMPWTRIVGNMVLSHLTRLATGYRHVFDSQCGYTAANRRALEVILSGPMFPRYGYPNHLLTRLAAANARVKDVSVRPVYGPAWRSGIRLHRVALPLLILLASGMIGRIRRRTGRWFLGALDTDELPR